jgi:pimeloyl-ACP methyl ester carboxylesterase
MPLARNSIDGLYVYYEDDDGPGTPVVLLNGLGDPIASSRAWGAASVLGSTHRCVFIDHRGHGLSGKPHEAEAYSTPKRVQDIVAVLDFLGIQRAHFIGLSWGARLLFGVGEHAHERVLSLTMGGQMPYAMDRESPGIKMVSEAFATGRSMSDFIEALGGFGEMDDETRARTLDNDFLALAAAWQAAMAESHVAPSLSSWDIPCLIYAGTADVDFFDGAKRAAEEIPHAHFIALEGKTHIEAHENVNEILPHIRRLLGD